MQDGGSPKDITKKRLWAWVLLASVLLVLSFIIVLFIPLNLSRFHERIEYLVESNVTGVVRFSHITVKVLPSPDIRLTGVEAYQNGEKLLSAERLHARVSLVPLLYGRTVFQDLEAENAEMILRRDAEGRLNLREFLKREKKEDQKKEEEQEKKPEGKKSRTSIMSMRIKDARLLFLDSKPEQPASFEIANINAEIGEKGGVLAYSGKGLLLPSTPVVFSGKKNRDTIEGQGLVSGLDLSRFNPYLKKPGSKVSGKADINLSYAIAKGERIKAGVDYRDLEAIYPSTFANPIYSSSGKGIVDLAIGAGEKPFILDITSIVLNMDGFRVNGSFDLSGPKGKKEMTIAATSTPVPLSKVKSLLPIKKLQPSTVLKINSFSPKSGSVSIKELRLSGKLEDYKGAILMRKPGGALIDLAFGNASFNYGGLKKTFTDISGDLRFKDGALHIDALSGKYGKEVLQSLKGRVNDPTGKAVLDLSLAGTADVGEGLDILKENARGAIAERISRAEASGALDIRANLAGSIKDKEHIRYSGNTVLRDGALSYKGVPVALDTVNAEADFDNENISIKNARISSGPSGMDLSGRVEGYRGPAPAFDISASGSISGNTFNQAAGKGQDELSVEGPVKFSAAAKGRKGDFTASVKADATGARIALKKYIDKSEGFPVRAEIDGSIKGREAAITRSSLDFGSSSIKGSGTLRTDSRAYSFSLFSEQVRISDIDEISPFLNRPYESSGNVSFNIKADRGASSKRALYSGEFSVSNGRFSTSLFQSPVENVGASARFDGNSGNIRIDKLTVGSTELNGSIDIIDLAGRTVKFSLTFPMLHSADLMPAKKEEKPQGAVEAKPAEKAKEEEERRPLVTGKGTVTATEGDLWGHKFKALSSEVLLDGTGLHMHPVSLEIDKGRTSGSVSFYLDKTEPYLFTTDLSISNIDFETMLQAFGAKKKTLAGKLRGDIILSAERGKKPFSKGLNGQFSLYTDKGKIWKFGVLSDIFSVVNIISIDELFQKGLQYKGIQGNFQVKEGVISTDDLSLDSDSIRMSAVGEINLPDGTMDATLALHPFVTIDKIISNIPLAGWIITGKKESALSLYFGIEGPVKDPDISPLPVKSLSENVFGILERLIRAPLKLFNQD